MKTPKISIIIPVYNREKTIKRALDSLLRQSYLDFEAICIDDGSTDKSSIIIKSYTDPRIVYLYKKNGGPGPGSACNKGLRAARGEIIAYLDSDDEYLPNHLEVLIEHFEKHPQIDVFYSKHQSFYENGSPVWTPDVTDFNNNMLKNKKYTTFCSIVNIDVAHKKSCIEKIGYFQEKIFFEDWDYWIKLLENFNAYFIDEHLANYYIHDNNIIKSISLADTYKDFIINYIKKNDLVLPYEEYPLDAIKVLVMFSGININTAESLFKEFSTLFPENPYVSMGGAHIYFYNKNFPRCRELCEKTLTQINPDINYTEKNLYFLSHYLISACCIGEPAFKETISKFHNIKDSKKLTNDFLKINLKLLRYFGGMFFIIAIRIMQAYKAK